MPIKLPNINRNLTKITALCKQLFSSEKVVFSAEKKLTFEKQWSLLTGGLSTVALCLLLFTYREPVQRLISPFLSPLQALETFLSDKKSQKTFAFIPGWTLTKLDDVDLDHTDTIAFYDLPVTTDGIATDSDGYAIFKSVQAATLFTHAKEKHKKVLVTLSQTTNETIGAILDNPTAQQTIITDAIAAVKDTDINGVVVDFEYTGSAGEYYRPKFTKFVSGIRTSLKTAVPNSTVTVALGAPFLQQSFYDAKALSSASDQIFVMAYDVAVPENKNNVTSAPSFGYNASDYMKDINKDVEPFTKQVAQDKLVLETAWYGNGDEYPFYAGGEGEASKFTYNTLTTPLSPEMIESLVAEVPADARDAARKNIPFIAKALQDEKILNPNVLAYALATIEHETAGTFQPLEEIKGRRSARRLGYEGGTNYFGRGFIQLTHLRNYKKIGERIGVGDELVRHPDLAASPEVAARVLAAFFKDNGIAQLATQGRFVAARTPINPDVQGYWIASLAEKYLYTIG